METQPTDLTGGARELAELRLLYEEYVLARTAEQLRHAEQLALLDATVSVLLTNYLEALTGQATSMAASAVVSLITPMLSEIKKMHAELLAMQASLEEQYNLLMKTRGDGNEARMIINDHGRRLKVQERTTPDD